MVRGGSGITFVPRLMSHSVRASRQDSKHTKMSQEFHHDRCVEALQMQDIAIRGEGCKAHSDLNVMFSAMSNSPLLVREANS